MLRSVCFKTLIFFVILNLISLGNNLNIFYVIQQCDEFVSLTFTIFVGSRLKLSNNLRMCMQMFCGSREIPECPLTIYKLQTLEADHKRRLDPVFRALQAKNNLKLYFRRPLGRRCIFKAGSRGLLRRPVPLAPPPKKSRREARPNVVPAPRHWSEKVRPGISLR